MKKPFYEQPCCEFLEVRFEENIMSPKGYHKGGGGIYLDEDIFDNGEY